MGRIVRQKKRKGTTETAASLTPAHFSTLDSSPPKHTLHPRHHTRLGRILLLIEPPLLNHNGFITASDISRSTATEKTASGSASRHWSGIAVLARAAADAEEPEERHNQHAADGGPGEAEGEVGLFELEAVFAQVAGEFFVELDHEDGEEGGGDAEGEEGKLWVVLASDLRKR